MTNNMTSTDEYMQFYQQPLIDAMPLASSSIEGFLDATLMTTSPNTMSSSEGIMSPSNSYNQLTPKANAFKPIRKRSRASKNTPTTLLKANTSNFRALVQQFTGCPNTTTMSFAFHKGPITLNFQQGNKQKIQHHTTRKMPPFGTTSFDQVPWQKQTEQQVPRQELMQEQQSGNWLDHDHVNSTDVSDGLIIDDDFGLQELTLNYAFSSGNDGFLM